MNSMMATMNPDRANLVVSVRIYAGKQYNTGWAECKRWEYVMHLSNEDIDRLISPDCTDPTKAISQVRSKFLTSGAYQMFEKA